MFRWVCIMLVSWVCDICMLPLRYEFYSFGNWNICFWINFFYFSFAQNACHFLYTLSLMYALSLKCTQTQAHAYTDKHRHTHTEWRLIVTYHFRLSMPHINVNKYKHLYDSQLKLPVMWIFQICYALNKRNRCDILVKSQSNILFRSNAEAHVTINRKSVSVLLCLIYGQQERDRKMKLLHAGLVCSRGGHKGPWTLCSPERPFHPHNSLKLVINLIDS